MDALELDLAVDRRSFTVELSLAVGRETVALAGPSGAGKSTVLRAVAGLLRPDRGRIALDGEVLFDAQAGIDVPPERRRIGYVFQDYALFPHLTVAQNVAYAGRGHEAELLERFGIAELARARPAEISGGERQRVALARALARRPRLLLLDEPMAALDAHTRAAVRGELRSLLEDVSLPALLVAHDFEDAAALAGRVGILVEGRLVQHGSPGELVASPATPFVASLTGGNLVAGRAGPGPDGLTAIALEGGYVVYSTDAASGRVGVVVHPWEISLAREAPVDSTLNHVTGPVTTIVPSGNRVRVAVGPLVAEVTAASAERLGLRSGQRVVASFKATATRLVPLA